MKKMLLALLLVGLFAAPAAAHTPSGYTFTSDSYHRSCVGGLTPKATVWVGNNTYETVHLHHVKMKATEGSNGDWFERKNYANFDVTAPVPYWTGLWTFQSPSNKINIRANAYQSVTLGVDWDFTSVCVG